MPSVVLELHFVCAFSRLCAVRTFLLIYQLWPLIDFFSFLFRLVSLTAAPLWLVSFGPCGTPFPSRAASSRISFSKRDRDNWRAGAKGLHRRKILK